RPRGPSSTRCNAPAASSANVAPGGRRGAVAGQRAWHHGCHPWRPAAAAVMVGGEGASGTPGRNLTMMHQTLSRWFTVEQMGDVVVVRFAHTSIRDDEVVDEVRQQLYDMVGQGQRLFVLNLGPVTALASRALGVLVGLHRKLDAAGGRLV